MLTSVLEEFFQITTRYLNHGLTVSHMFPVGGVMLIIIALYSASKCTFGGPI